MNIIIIILTFTLFITSKGYSATSISIIGACTDAPLHQEFYSEVPEGWSIGDLTINFLDANQIPYIGSIQSIGEIESIPTEEHELIVISNEEMLAYGWCYKVNGFAPEEYPHKVMVLPGDKIVWYFAYSRYLKQRWVSQCVPSFQSPRQEFCKP
jgi:hypothetical protein